MHKLKFKGGWESGIKHNKKLELIVKQLGSNPLETKRPRTPSPYKQIYMSFFGHCQPIGS